MSPWQQHHGTLTTLNVQVDLLNEVLLNIYSNFIPNRVMTFRPHQAPWITDKVKSFLRNKNRVYRNFKRSGQPSDKLERIQNSICEGSKLIKDREHTC